MLVYGDDLRPLLEARIGPINPEGQTFGRIGPGGEPVCLVHFGNWRTGEIEIMGWAAPGGVSRGIIRALAVYAFRTLGVHRVTARAVVSNTDSLRILARLGFQREGTLRRAQHGEDVIVFGLLPEDLRHVQFAETAETDRSE